MLQLRVVRGPLERRENEGILKEYNRLTSSEIPMSEFLRWVDDSPAGPAWHAILETEEKRVVGHSSLIPMKTSYRGGEILPAKWEYSFVHEDFRTTPIEGFEKVARPKFMLMVDQLFKRCQAEGWGPFFASTAEENHTLSKRMGCRPGKFALWECIFILRPRMAARRTPNLSGKQRAAIYAAGIPQSALAMLKTTFPWKRNGASVSALPGEAPSGEIDRIGFFEDAKSLEWRYIQDQYLRYRARGNGDEFLIVKRGSPETYLRVCQWHLRSIETVGGIVNALLREAREEKALGVRWAIYEDGEIAAKLAGELKRHGFVCAPRTRTVIFYTKEPAYLDPALWKLSDSLFSFDP